jgi:plasmid stabilization system protein ParE
MDLVDGQAFQGRVVPEYQLDNLREVFVQGCRIWYWVRSDDIEVLAIFHGSRDTRS